jgi:hypothetical protein
MFVNYEKEMYERLFEEHGPLMWGEALFKTLGYKNNTAFRQSVYRKKCPVDVFDIDGRQGRYAHTHEVAAWLATLGEKNE